MPDDPQPKPDDPQPEQTCDNARPNPEPEEGRIAAFITRKLSLGKDSNSIVTVNSCTGIFRGTISYSWLRYTLS